MSELFKTGGCGHLSDKFTCFECHQDLQSLLAKERDEFGKKEAKMRAEITRLNPLHGIGGPITDAEMWARRAKVMLDKIAKLERVFVAADRFIDRKKDMKDYPWPGEIDNLEEALSDAKREG